jgi:hypothetical protein
MLSPDRLAASLSRRDQRVAAPHGRATSVALSVKSLLRGNIHCSGEDNSLFGARRESVRKPFRLQYDPGSATAKTAQNLQNSLIYSLFSGNSRRRIAAMREAAGG